MLMLPFLLMSSGPLASHPQSLLTDIHLRATRLKGWWSCWLQWLQWLQWDGVPGLAERGQPGSACLASQEGISASNPSLWEDELWPFACLRAPYPGPRALPGCCQGDSGAL